MSVGPFTSYWEQTETTGWRLPGTEAYIGPVAEVTTGGFPRAMPVKNGGYSCNIVIEQNKPAQYCAYCGTRRDPARAKPTCEQCGAPQRVDSGPDLASLQADLELLKKMAVAR